MVLLDAVDQADWPHRVLSWNHVPDYYKYGNLQAVGVALQLMPDNKTAEAVVDRMAQVVEET